MQTKEAPKYIKNIRSSIYVYNLRNLVFARAESIFGINGIYYLAATKQALRFASICYYRRLSFARLALKNIIYGIHVQCTWVCCILGTVYLVSVHGHGALWQYRSIGKPLKSNVQLMNLTANSNCFIMDYAFRTLISFSVVNIHTLLAIQSNI